MKKILIGGTVAVLCFSGIQDVGAGRAMIGAVGSRGTIAQQPPAQQPSQPQPPTQNQVQQPVNNGAWQIINGQLVSANGQVVPAGQVQIDPSSWGSNALTLWNESSTISNYGTNLRKYLRWTGKFATKLPVTNKRLANNVSSEVKPLVYFVEALSKSTTKASKAKGYWDKFSKKLSSLKRLSDEFEKVAIVRAALLLSDPNEINALAADKQTYANEAGQKLLQFVVEKELIPATL